ncbi:MAG: VOC family protein, partial [Candidatus Nanopelagicales bacterium]
LLTADGGEESQCGWLIDKFGISWQVTSPEMLNYLNGEDKAGAERATKAMLEMKKIDLETLNRAYFGQ